MAEGFLYLDSSALVKLILPEAETDALIELLADWKDRVSSAIAVVEVHRATRRTTQAEAVQRRASQVLSGIHTVTVDEDVLGIASMLEPATLRSLDAIHLASALILQPDLRALVAYDQRLAEAARQQGLTVLAPA